MLFYTSGQIYIFLAALFAGIVIGVWYDILRIVRRILAAGMWISLAADIAFGLGAGLIAICCLYISCYGEVRLYSIIGMLMGCFLYLATVSRLMRAAGKNIRSRMERFQKKFQKN